MHKLTAENAALRLQLAQMQKNAMIEVRRFCLLHVRIHQCARQQLFVQMLWNLYLCICLRARNLRGRNHLVVLLCATQNRQKKPAALALNVVCLHGHA